MNSIKKILAALFALMFVVSAIAALFLFNLDRRAFTAETYQKAFANADFYNRLPAIMAETVDATVTNKEQIPLVMSGTSTQQWENFFRMLLPEDVSKAMGDEALNSVFAYWNMQSDSAEISMMPLKSAMTSDAGVQAVFSLLKTQPACSLSQIAQMTLDLLGNNQIELCNPPQELAPILTPVIQSQMQMAAIAIPDKITLISAPAENDPRQTLKLARVLMRFSPVFPLILLLIITVMMVNSLKSWLNWWGIPFLFTGTVAGLMSLGGAPATSAVLRRILESRLPAFLPAVLLEYADNLSSAMVQALLRPILWQSALLAMLGLMMTATAFFVKTKR